MAMYAFGLIGAAIANATQKDKDKYVFKINYSKGNSIPISPAPSDGIIKFK
jgi:hypothetical protein